MDFLTTIRGRRKKTFSPYGGEECLFPLMRAITWLSEQNVLRSAGGGIKKRGSCEDCPESRCVEIARANNLTLSRVK